MRPFRGSDGSPYVGEAVRSSRGAVPPSPTHRGRFPANPAAARLRPGPDGPCARRELAASRPRLPVDEDSRSYARAAHDAGRAPGVTHGLGRRYPVSDPALNPRQVDGFFAAGALGLLPQVPEAPPRPLPGRTARQAFTTWLVSIGVGALGWILFASVFCRAAQPVVPPRRSGAAGAGRGVRVRAALRPAAGPGGGGVPRRADRRLHHVAADGRRLLGSQRPRGRQLPGTLGLPRRLGARRQGHRAVGAGPRGGPAGALPLTGATRSAPGVDRDRVGSQVPGARPALRHPAAAAVSRRCRAGRGRRVRSAAPSSRRAGAGRGRRSGRPSRGRAPR